MKLWNEAPDLTKGLVAGAAAGLLASFMMEQFQALWSSVGKSFQDPKEKTKRRQKPTTVKAADAVAEKIVGTKVPRKHQQLAGEAMHYAMGTGSAALYGVVAEVFPPATVGEGTAFGTAVWLAADEGALPALGLTKSPAQIPVSTHVYALASHLVYGFVVEVVRRGIRSAL